MEDTGPYPYKQAVKNAHIKLCMDPYECLALNNAASKVIHIKIRTTPQSNTHHMKTAPAKGKHFTKHTKKMNESTHNAKESSAPLQSYENVHAKLRVKLGSIEPVQSHIIGIEV
ncbi:hypothetical protein BS47DRAFT_1361427 [Hydnum rufescens UP504]|uniref:Uncharacterized protein n=1 Tax=Hydnum rufescens UP504 TaxID=1448309 RepID=A0A9P6AZS1_9AGAM|nr:hypothetical protein BS47DRAFT_1361427 [Hydnum rufescens UP504]